MQLFLEYYIRFEMSIKCEFIFLLDTSALLKRYKTEYGTHRVNQLFLCSDDSLKRIITSVFTNLEVVSSAEQLKRSGNISETAYIKLLKSFTEDSVQSIHFLPIDNSIVLNATENAKDFFLRPGDAIQYSAFQKAHTLLAGYGMDCIFIGSDNRLNQAVSMGGYTVFDPALTTQEDWHRIIIS